jgi:hypothetical protein
LETLAFVERPRGGLAPGKSWDLAEPGQPPLTWSLTGTDFMPNGNCLKLTGQQQSDGWGHRGQPGWGRKDNLWLALDTGVAVKIERHIQHCDEAGATTFKSEMVVVLDSFRPTDLPPSEIEARRLEISQAVGFARTLESLSSAPDQRGFDALLAQIQAHTQNRVATTYREAVLGLKRQAEAARNGERPPEPLVVQTRKDAPPTGEGQPVPDLILSDMISGETVRMSRFQGRPVLLVLFRPAGRTVDHVLRFANSAANTYASRVDVLALAVDGTPGEIVQLRLQYHVKMPIYDGREIAKRIAGDATPRTILIDASGTIQRILPGWGGEYPTWFGNELEKLIQR